MGRRTTAVLLLLLTIFAVYLPALPNAFVWDDISNLDEVRGREVHQDPPKVKISR